MRTFAVVALSLVIAVRAFAEEPRDARTERRLLAMRVLEAIDAERFTRELFEVVFQSRWPRTVIPDDLPPQVKEALTAQAVKQEADITEVRSRLYQRFDLRGFVEETDLPIVESRFTDDELREVAAFARTKAGQKTLALMGELSAATVTRGKTQLEEPIEQIAEELLNEESEKDPMEKTRRDIMLIGIAMTEYLAGHEELPAAYTVEDMRRALSPALDRTPLIDGWGEPYVLVLSADRKHYRVASGGEDRRIEWESRVMGAKGNGDDLVLQDLSW